MKIIDGKVREICSTQSNQAFFDFEFWAESDEDNYGIVCLIQKTEPNHLVIIEMEKKELEQVNDSNCIDMLKQRVSTLMSMDESDFILPKILRFNESEAPITEGFQSFLEAYKDPVPVYESIFEPGAEAIEKNKLSYEQFIQQGGKITLIGDIEFRKSVVSE